MESMEDWQRAKYDTVFEQMCQYVRRRRAEDPQFNVEALVRLLETQYIHQGSEPGGKSTIQHITEAATAAAFESVLAQWQQEEGAR
jgi:hypothetical protein